MDIPTLVLFGDYVDQSPRWAPRLKMCRAFAEAMKKAGGKTELVVLPDLGIKGNSHMLMQDKNSLEIADWLLAWIDKHIEQKGQ
jgi:multimeric flavodoxin WrbA